MTPGGLPTGYPGGSDKNKIKKKLCQVLCWTIGEFRNYYASLGSTFGGRLLPRICAHQRLVTLDLNTRSNCFSVFGRHGPH